jgi:hypothetical protein
MVQFVAATGFKGMPLYFNLSNPVGRGYPNAPMEDVSLVQFCFVAASANQKQPMPPELKMPWDKVKVTGRSDDATLAAINAWQGYRRKRFGAHVETDGIVSVARTTSGLYAPELSYDIVHLNFIILVLASSNWPRLDKEPQCTPVLGAAIRAAISEHLTP